MNPDRVTFLACGWSLPRDETHGTAIALQDGDETVLVDAGGGVAKQLARIDGLASLERVYLTHEHPDHLSGFAGLVHALRFTDRDRPLALAGPQPALARARSSLEALGVTYPFTIEDQPLEEAEGSDGWVRWAPLDHSVPTLGYRFADVTVLGDTRPTEASVELARGSSLLVHEASHTDEELCHETGHATPADAGRIAARADAGQLALVHVHPSLPLDRAVDEASFPRAMAPADGDQLRWTGETWSNKGRP
jgi:ribonuclease Z